MSKRCTKCGTFLTETDRFCPNCGENAPQELENAPVHNSSIMTMPAAPTPPPPQYNGGQNMAYNPPPAPPPYTSQYNPYQKQEEEMSVGNWVLTIFVTQLGFIGLIFLLVWGFGSGPKARQNFCKAMLIFYAVAIGIVVLMMLFFLGMGISISDAIRDEYYNSYNTAQTLMGMFF